MFAIQKKLASVSFAVAFGLAALTACAPNGGSPVGPLGAQGDGNNTGFQGADGKGHTGAGPDRALDDLKANLLPPNAVPGPAPAASGSAGSAGNSSGSPTTSDSTNEDEDSRPGISIDMVPKADRELAASIVDAILSQKAPEKGGDLRIAIKFSDRRIITFDFTPAEIIAKGTALTARDTDQDVRYKSVFGKLLNGNKTTYELAMVCRKSIAEAGKPVPPGCRIATVAIRDTRGSGARAGLVLRRQETRLLAKSTTANPVNPHLKRILTNLREVKDVGVLQSFEVAWGASGFYLTMDDPKICPAGRLVETNDSDEPLKVACSGVTDVRGVEGSLIGNTTRGELFIELFAGQTEHVFILVRPKPPVKASQTNPRTEPPGAAANPPTVAPNNPPSVGRPDRSAELSAVLKAVDVDIDQDDEIDIPLFSDEKREAVLPRVTSPRPQNNRGRSDAPITVVPPTPTSGTKGWLIPFDFSQKITQSWAEDRANPVVDKGVKKWLKDSRIKNFATYFRPNRDLVLTKLRENNVPAEFAFITLIESNFFKMAGYPIEKPATTSALGPWQMIDGTAKNNGLRIFPARLKHPCDERTDLEKSTAAAGRYIRDILDMFPYDPKLAILGYNQGEYGVQKTIDRLKKNTSRLTTIRELGLNYWAIRKFNMAGRHGLQYVIDFLSIYHATLEMEEIPLDPSIPKWKPTTVKCQR